MAIVVSHGRKPKKSKLLYKHTFRSNKLYKIALASSVLLNLILGVILCLF